MEAPSTAVSRPVAGRSAASCSCCSSCAARQPAIGIIFIAAIRSTTDEAKCALAAVKDRLFNYAQVHHALEMAECSARIDGQSTCATRAGLSADRSSLVRESKSSCPGCARSSGKLIMTCLFHWVVTKNQPQCQHQTCRSREQPPAKKNKLIHRSIFFSSTQCPQRQRKSGQHNDNRKRNG